MTVNYQDLGLRVRDARKAKHLTQEQLAEKVGISSSVTILHKNLVSTVWMDDTFLLDFACCAVPKVF